MSHPKPSRTEVRVGVAGWDYADWRGPVYPPAAGPGFDRLGYIARFVDVVEVNSSFYRPIVPRVAESWVRRTESRPGFRFTAKAHRSWTHGDPDDATTRAMLDGLRPIHESGRLGALLLQFPQAFHNTPAARQRIASLLPRAAGWPVVAEVRHVSWLAASVADWFREHGLGWCAVDQPEVGRHTLRALPRVTGHVAYLRLHGRNTADWFRPDAGRDARYDYLYSLDELKSLAATARRMGETAEQLFVIQNNHFRGQALANALQMSALISDTAPLAPEELVATYPDLVSQVRVERHRLF